MDNMKKFTYIFIGGFALFILLGLVLMNLLLNKNTTDENIPALTTPRLTPPVTFMPTFTPFPLVPPEVEIDLIRELPYEEGGFLVEYLPDADLFYVTIKGEPYDENIRRAEEWLENRGVPYPRNNADVRFRTIGFPVN